MKIPLDKYGQMNLTEPWHYELLNILEEVCSPLIDSEKTLTAYMSEIIETVERGLYETSS